LSFGQDEFTQFDLNSLSY